MELCRDDEGGEEDDSVGGEAVWVDDERVGRVQGGLDVAAVS